MSFAPGKIHTLSYALDRVFPPLSPGKPRGEDPRFVIPPRAIEQQLLSRRLCERLFANSSFVEFLYPGTSTQSLCQVRCVVIRLRYFTTPQVQPVPCCRNDERRTATNTRKQSQQEYCADFLAVQPRTANTKCVPIIFSRLSRRLK